MARKPIGTGVSDHLRAGARQAVTPRAQREAKTAAATPAVAGAQTAPAEGEQGGKKDFMQGLSKMFEGEEGKKMLKMQSDMAVKMMYGDLAKELKLSAKDADIVLAMLSERQGMLTTAGMAAMNGGEADGKRIGEMKKEQDAKLKAVLGEEGFKQLESYEGTVGDRMMLQQFDGQFNAAGVPLAGEQKQGLLAVMKAERAKTPPSPLRQSAGGDPSAAMAAMNDENAVAAFQSGEAAYQDRVLQNAASVLNPDQINALKSAFEQQKTMMEFGMKMMKGMKDNAAPTAVPAAK